MSPCLRAQVAAAVAATLLGWACTGGDDGPTPQSSPGVVPPAAGEEDRDSTSAGADEDEVSTEVGEDQGGPLVAFLYLSGESPDVDEEERRYRRRHQLIADCMAAQGFDYEVPGFEDTSDADAQHADVWQLPREEFVARYGFGITTIEQGDGPAPPVLEATEGATAGGEGPSRSAEEKAYLIAMYGSAGAHDVRRDGPHRGPDDPDDRGCHGEARKTIEVESGDEPVDLAPFAALADEIGALWDRIEQDPRVLQARRAWSDCMADAGHPGLEDRPDAQAAVRARMRAAVSSIESSETGSEDGLADDSGLERGLVAALAESDPAALREVRNLELSIAAADDRCGRPYDQTRWAVRDEIEQRFLDARRDELEAYRDALAAANGGY